MRERGFYLCGSGWGQVKDFCKYGNKLSGSITCGRCIKGALLHGVGLFISTARPTDCLYVKLVSMFALFTHIISCN
jgi:hypothetical protein